MVKPAQPRPEELLSANRLSVHPQGLLFQGAVVPRKLANRGSKADPWGAA